MYTQLGTAAASAAILMATVAIAQAQARRGASAGQTDRPIAAAQSNAAAGHVQAPAEDQGRYRHHNGRWWYWLPENRWVVWQRGAWVPYSAGMFAESRVNSLSTRRYSYDSQPQGSSRGYRASRAFGSSRSIRYAGSKINFDYLP
jgi:hypothetical protein